MSHPNWLRGPRGNNPSLWPWYVRWFAHLEGEVRRRVFLARLRLGPWVNRPSVVGVLPDNKEGRHGGQDSRPGGDPE